MEEFEREFKQFEGGAYSETPQQWLLASWQGDALQVSKLAQEHNDC